VSLLNLNRVEDLLMRTRIELVELKRTGSLQGLPELTADVTKLKGKLERLEELLKGAGTGSVTSSSRS
jgi:hypothetical protein